MLMFSACYSQVLPILPQGPSLSIYPLVCLGKEIMQIDTHDKHDIFRSFFFVSQVFLLYLLHRQFNVIDVSLCFSIRCRYKRQYLQNVLDAHCRNEHVSSLSPFYGKHSSVDSLTQLRQCRFKSGAKKKKHKYRNCELRSVVISSCFDVATKVDIWIHVMFFLKKSSRSTFCADYLKKSCDPHVRQVDKTFSRRSARSLALMQGSNCRRVFQ